MDEPSSIANKGFKYEAVMFYDGPCNTNDSDFMMFFSLHFLQEDDRSYQLFYIKEVIALPLKAKR